MIMPKEYKIGETLEYEGVRLKVVEDLQRNCGNCYFYIIGKCNSANTRMSYEVGPCNSWDRSDRKYVLYLKEK